MTAAESVFRCALCGRRFETTPAEDARARAEAEADWPDVAIAEMVVVCEGCYADVLQREREAVKH